MITRIAHKELVDIKLVVVSTEDSGLITTSLYNGGKFGETKEYGDYIGGFKSGELDSRFKKQLYNAIKESSISKDSELKPVCNEILSEFKEQIDPKNDYVAPQDIQEEANKIISEKRVEEYILEYLSHYYLSDISQKKLVINSSFSLGVENVDEPLHQHTYGNPEVGKSVLYKLLKDVMPDSLKTVIDDFTPKALIYMRLEPNKLIVINDAIITDELGAYLNNGCDITAWQGGFTHGTVGKADGDMIGRVVKLPPRLLYWISSNKSIPEYRKEHSTVDYNAIATRFYSHNKTYTEEQIREIQKFLYEKNLPKDIGRKKEIIQQIYRVICTTPRHINQGDIKFDEIKHMLPPALREPQRIYTMLKCNALIRDSDKVERIDIDAIAKLLNEVSSEELKFVQDTPRILAVLEHEDVFKTFDLKSDTVRDLFNRDGIAKRSGINKNTLSKRLRKLEEKGEIVSIQDKKNWRQYLYYKKKDRSPCKYSDEEKLITKEVECNEDGIPQI